jgi:TRAP-type uncharacterized transport system substrate-binding protein
MHRFIKVAFCILALATIAFPANAETVEATRAKVNGNAVGIMAGSMSGTDMALANDLGLAFSDGYDLRVVAMVGLGSVRDVEDLLYFRGVDMAIVQQDVIDFMVAQNIYPALRERIRLIAPLSVDQFHVLAAKTYNSIHDLAGQKVNFGPTDGGTLMTSSVVFGKLGIEVEITNFAHDIALEKLRKGEIAAMTRASGKPVSVIEKVQPGEPFHLLAVPQEALAETYGPATLTAADYPALIPAGEEVATVAVANALIGYNWPREHQRGQAMAHFAECLFKYYDRLLDGAYHESWKEIDIARDVPGLAPHWARELAMQKVGR